ncbi:hypothetical protein EJK17_03565 [Lactobacillus xujianguonis]|uniref:DUF3784 domain-containing protein n=1 Tax=Lactobacillus xujianguonis TaxID=2495899 RepID=A0A437SWP9_9LACO|nr:hypothetical protein [Lactobacillus xujianguonis]RVU71280.1 hypothetical protein EJK17_03565 [Lactobacillus xujianguonis]
MAIMIVMIIFILLLMLTAWYLWHRRGGHFLIYDVGGNPRLGTIFKWTSIALLVVSLLGIVILFMANKYANLITLILGSLTILIFSLLINQNNG